MALVGGDIIRFTAFQTMQSQMCLNVFFYELISNSGDADYEDLANQFALQWGVFISPIQHAALTMNLVRVENLSNGIDYLDYATSQVGDQVGEYYPIFNAWAFRLLRSSKVTRNGAKRFASIAEADASAGIPVAGAITRLNAAAGWLGNDFIWDVGGTPDFELRPVIIGRTEVIGGGGEPTYELDLTKRNYVQSAQFVNITSQNTRKLGVGS